MAQTRKALPGDPCPCAVEADRVMHTTLIEYLYEQRLISVKPKVEDLFAPSVMDI